MLTFPPDITFVIQIISFLLLWAALKRLAFDPMLDLLAEREKRTHGGMEEAEVMRAAAQSAQQQYETTLRDLRHAVLVDAEAARQRGANEGQQQLATARSDADAELVKLRADLRAQVERAQVSLAAEAKAIAALMAERVSGRSLA